MTQTDPREDANPERDPDRELTPDQVEGEDTSQTPGPDQPE